MVRVLDFLTERFGEQSTLLHLAIFIFMLNYMGIGYQEIEDVVADLMHEWDMAMIAAINIFGMLKRG